MHAQGRPQSRIYLSPFTKDIRGGGPLSKALCSYFLNVPGFGWAHTAIHALLSAPFQTAVCRCSGTQDGSHAPGCARCSTARATPANGPTNMRRTRRRLSSLSHVESSQNNISVRSGIRTHAHRSGLRPERSALDRSAILTDAYVDQA